MKTAEVKDFKIKDNHGHIVNSHETFLVGFNAQGQIVFFKSYHYPTQKNKAQRDVKLVEEQCAFWEFGAASEFKIEHENRKFEIIIPHP